ncbi:hypothetical protein C0J52_26009 [Blattella germanica]|nr:hypothetical protein C0J52_26009 [Blattella germanica]
MAYAPFFIKCVLITTIVCMSCQADNTVGDLFRINKVKKHSKIGSLFYLAKDYLQNANVYNTSVEFTVPLFSFTFATLENPNDYTSLMKQNLVGQAIFFVVVIVSFVLSIAFPVFINDLYPQTRTFSNPLLQDFLERLHGRPFEDGGGVCLKNAVCEAHTSSGDFGLLALPFKYFSSSLSSLNTSKWKHYEDCQLQHHCPFSILRLLRYFGHVSLRYIGLT